MTLSLTVYPISVVLGQGGQWAAVTGFDGTMPDVSSELKLNENRDESDTIQELNSPEISVHKKPYFPHLSQHGSFADTPVAVTLSASEHLGMPGETADNEFPLPNSSARVGGSDSLPLGRSGSRPSCQASVFVGKKHGDGIFVDDPAFLAEWSVDAMKLIRRHLFRAGNGRVPIPCVSNWEYASWPDESPSPERKLPLWAKVAVANDSDTTVETELCPHDPTPQRVSITNLTLMVSEVSELLDVMEGMMALQRRRRLDRLQAPSWLRSNWYLVAFYTPVVALVARRLSTKGYGKQAIKFVVLRVATFFRERVVDPVAAM